MEDFYYDADYHGGYLDPNYSNTSDNISFVIIIVIILICLIIYFYLNRPCDENRRKKYRKIYNSSSGGFDEKASTALDTIDEIENPNPTDHFVAGEIIGYNVLQGNLRNAGNDRHTMDNVIDRFERAIQGVTRQYNTAENRRNTRQNYTEGDLPPGFIIDRVGDFIAINLEGDIDPLILEHLFELDNQVEQAGSTTFNQKKNVSLEASKSKEDFTKKLTSQLLEHTSDNQNVHDSSVVKTLKETLEKIRKTTSNKPAQTVIGEIYTYAKMRAGIPLGGNSQNSQNSQNVNFISNPPTRKDYISIAKYNDIVKAIGAMKNGTSKLTSYDESESNILKYVWDRTNLIENADNHEDLKEAVLDALASCIENNSLVCTGGRVSKVLGSLARLDSDPLVGNAVRLEDYKNEIFRQCPIILNKKLEQAKQAGEEMKKVAENYENPKIDCDEELAEKFAEEVKKEISDYIDKYKNSLSEAKIKELKKECCEAIL